MSWVRDRPDRGDAVRGSAGTAGTTGRRWRRGSSRASDVVARSRSKGGKRPWVCRGSSAGYEVFARHEMSRGGGVSGRARSSEPLLALPGFVMSEIAAVLTAAYPAGHLRHSSSGSHVCLLRPFEAEARSSPRWGFWGERCATSETDITIRCALPRVGQGRSSVNARSAV